ncbi:MAG TPA: hypothetical protein VF952_19735 [Chloroflexia bacterium]|jgi:hypothetical protein
MQEWNDRQPYQYKLCRIGYLPSCALTADRLKDLQKLFSDQLRQMSYPDRTSRQASQISDAAGDSERLLQRYRALSEVVQPASSPVGGQSKAKIAAGTRLTKSADLPYEDVPTLRSGKKERRTSQDWTGDVDLVLRNIGERLGTTLNNDPSGGVTYEYIVQKGNDREVWNRPESETDVPNGEIVAVRMTLSSPMGAFQVRLGHWSAVDGSLKHPQSVNSFVACSNDKNVVSGINEELVGILAPCLKPWNDRLRGLIGYALLCALPLVALAAWILGFLDPVWLTTTFATSLLFIILYSFVRFRLFPVFEYVGTSRIPRSASERQFLFIAILFVVQAIVNVSLNLLANWLTKVWFDTP